VQSATKCVSSVALLIGALIASASMSYGSANAFFNKTFVVTFDLGPNYQMIAGNSNVEARFYVSSDGEVFFYPGSTEKTGCFGSGGPTTKVNQIKTTSHVCDEVSVATTSSVSIDGNVLTYTETRLVTSSASRNKSRTQRAYSFRFVGRKCEALRYIVEGILMSPVSCRVENGNTAG
jgi:hypothetical protein